jgi:hypothetical protein
MNVLFIETDHDSVTAQVHKSRRNKLKASTIRASHNLIELYSNKATSSDAKSAWLSIPGNFGLVSGMGHGDPDEFLGYNNAVVFGNGAIGNSAYSGAVVHLYSCNCGKILASRIMNTNAKAFVGYNDFVLLPGDPSLNDLFIAAAVEIDLAILNGLSSTTAKSKADSAYQGARNQLLADPTATASDVAALESNYAAMVGPWSSASFGAF